MKQWTEEEINRLVPEATCINRWESLWKLDGENGDFVIREDDQLWSMLLQTRLDLENASKALERISASTDQMGGQTWSSEIARKALEEMKEAPHD